MEQSPLLASIPLPLPTNIPTASIPFLFLQAQPAHGTCAPTPRIRLLNLWAVPPLIKVYPAPNDGRLTML